MGIIDKIKKKIEYHRVWLPLKRIRERREKYYDKLRKKISGIDTPTIIAKDCFGTFMYHNLGLRFNSPTINLSFSTDDFLLFLENIDGFLRAPVEEVIDNNVEYPVGKLTFNDKTIRLSFMHYNSFDEAKQKWIERKARINFNNLRVVFLVAEGITKEHVIRFKNLPFKNKYLITTKNVLDWGFKEDFIFTHKVFKKDYVHGKILQYKSEKAYKRYMDDLPYVDWIKNNKQ